MIVQRVVYEKVTRRQFGCPLILTLEWNPAFSLFDDGSTEAILNVLSPFTNLNDMQSVHVSSM